MLLVKRVHVFCKNFFPKIAKRFSPKLQNVFPQSCKLHFPLLKHCNRICIPVGFKIAPLLPLVFPWYPRLSTAILPPCSWRAAPGWLLITAFGARPFGRPVIKIGFSSLCFLYMPRHLLTVSLTWWSDKGHWCWTPSVYCSPRGTKEGRSDAWACPPERRSSAHHRGHWPIGRIPGSCWRWWIYSHVSRRDNQTKAGPRFYRKGRIPIYPIMLSST